MAAPLLPGNNELVLCGAALCAIVEQHLRDCSYSKDNGAVRVAHVRVVDSAYHFSVTTDPKKESAT